MQDTNNEMLIMNKTIAQQAKTIEQQTKHIESAPIMENELKQFERKVAMLVRELEVQREKNEVFQNQLKASRIQLQQISAMETRIASYFNQNLL